MEPLGAAQPPRHGSDQSAGVGGSSSRWQKPIHRVSVTRNGHSRQERCEQSITWPLISASQEQTHRLEQRRISQRLNNRRRQVAELHRDLIATVQARFAEPMVNTEIEGGISGVQSYGFFVEIPPSMVEGLVHVSSLNDDWYEYRSRQNRLVGRSNRRTYQLGDPGHRACGQGGCFRNQIDLDVIPEPIIRLPVAVTTQDEQETTLVVTVSVDDVDSLPYVLAVTGASAQPLAERALQRLLERERPSCGSESRGPTRCSAEQGACSC